MSHVPMCDIVQAADYLIHELRVRLSNMMSQAATHGHASFCTPFTPKRCSLSDASLGTQAENRAITFASQHERLVYSDHRLLVHLLLCV